jgi:nucleoid-associated protein YgaU
MTRENKLALVVGFGLILFVGILISDHFSTVRNQQVANLQPMMEPLIDRANDAKVIDLLPPTPAVSTTSIANAQDPVRPEQRTMINPDGFLQPRIVQQPGAELRAMTANSQPTPDGFVQVEPDPPATQVKVQFHDVESGETLFAICREHYGDIALVQALAQYNRMDDPAALKVGRRLMIPPAEQIGGRAVATTTSAPAQSAPPTQPKPSTPSKPSNPTTYVVKSGDSLAGIAQRFLGSKSKWKKLHDMNRDVIEDPDDLKIGTVLKVANG